MKHLTIDILIAFESLILGCDTTLTVFILYYVNGEKNAMQRHDILYIDSVNNSKLKNIYLFC